MRRLRVVVAVICVGGAGALQSVRGANPAGPRDQGGVPRENARLETDYKFSQVVQEQQEAAADWLGSLSSRASSTVVNDAAAAAVAAAPAVSSRLEEEEDVDDDDRPSRTLRLRDCIWARQAIDNLVAAEFALRLELAGDSTGSFVDFERLREELDARLDELADGAGLSALGDEDRRTLQLRAQETASALDVAAKTAREIQLRHAEMQVTTVLGGEMEEDEPQDSVDFIPWLSKVGRKFGDELGRRFEAVAELGTLALRGPPKENASGAAGANATSAPAVVYVRDDGSVDWEGALAGARSATAFSVDLWRRINGVGDEHAPSKKEAGEEPDHLNNLAEEEEEEDALGLGKNAELRQVILDDASRRAREIASEYEEAVAAREAVGGSSVYEEASTIRASLRRAEAQVLSCRGAATIAALELAMERCCRLLEDEIAAPDSRRTRRVVAEFALLDAQLVALSRDSRSVGVVLLKPELELLAREIRDFATRLGALAEFEYFHLLEPFSEVYSSRSTAAAPVDGSIAAFTSRLPSTLAQFSLGTDRVLSQIRRGAGFYIDGTRLLGNDLAFCTRLVAKAMFDGETLVPRDVRVLRRTVKDLATSVPFIIILIIPLSPFGHILVFSAIQRFFPDFFPTCFTERRQNLVRLYSAAEINKLPMQQLQSTRKQRQQQQQRHTSSTWNNNNSQKKQ